MTASLNVRHLGTKEYTEVWQEMSRFTNERDAATVDELWLVQHPSVFTQGQAGKPEHVLNPGKIPVVQSDRGGQVTYHGPGQLIAYTLINLRRRELGVRDMVSLLETVAVDLLEEYGIKGYAKKDAPGVYVAHQAGGSKNFNRESKIASLGLRVRKGCCFHGMSINVDMDLSPFALINPCGYQGMEVSQLKDLSVNCVVDYEEVEAKVIKLISKKLSAPINIVNY